MSQTMFIAASLMNGALFGKMKHPMSMGIALLLQTVLMCVVTSSMSQNAWFSYILFLVFLGGMLVLFIYMTSVASNELFESNTNLTWVIGGGVIAISVLINDPMMMINNSEESVMMGPQTKWFETSSMFNYPINIMTLIAVLYLFLTLIVVVKITEAHQGPLRSSN